ncbi:MAG: hypothetical protein IKO22_05345 [Oscillospiraceae bacterium]|nr:hypothetical protein [Oscillospiraceae bacterium]
MNKKEQYQALIADVKRFYVDQERLHNHEPLYLTWYDDCEEINLWTYWQGRGNLDARIMLVGQDWGSPAACSPDYMRQFTEINKGKQPRYWLDGSSITDNNLISLFSSIGFDVSNGAPRNRDLFFTNFVLGYRNIGFSGGFKQKWLRENKTFFFRLTSIIEPEIIICLGRNAFRGVMMAFNHKAKIRRYNDFITGPDNPVEVSFPSGKIAYVFAEAHCGAMGTLNRKRLKDTDELTGLELQKKDWLRIEDYLK